MKQVSTREMVAMLKQIMQEQGVKQLVLVDDGCPGLMLHRNRADFTPSRGNAVRAFPGPFITVERAGA
ncbi:MAG: hypothetical protein ACYSWO_29960 [Planctomycetota bacterium]|jgi:hypothetical protein